MVESGQSIEYFRKTLRGLVDQHGWAEWGEGPIFDRRSLMVYKASSAIHYSKHRLAQLRDGGFTLWVYCVSDPFGECADHHSAFDRLILPHEHEFWNIWAPPNSYNCRCYVVGARSTRGAVRLNGDPDKSLPDWWDEPTRGPHKKFSGFGRPDLKEIVQAALGDEIV